MQIVIVSDFGDVNGGAARVAIASAHGLADAGIPVVFVCAIAPVSELLDHPRIAVHCLNLDSVWKRRNPFGAAMQGIWNRTARAALERILGSLAGDETIVHFHQWTKAFSPSVLAAPLALGMPAIVSLHDYFLVCPNGAYYRFPQATPCQLTPMSAACVASHCDSRSYGHKAVRVLRQHATGRVAGRAGASLSVIHVSAFAKQVVHRFIPEPHAQFVVTSPVQIARTAPVPVERNSDFVFVGRLTEEKGIRLLAEVARSNGLPLTIVGDGPLFTELQQFGGSVRCTGWLGGAALGDVMRQARALVFPSTWYETGGLVVLEALAQGIPVIVGRTTAPVDFVAHNVTGYIIDPADRMALSNSMLQLTNDAVAVEMGTEAYRQYWLNPPTEAKHVRDLLPVYQTVFSDHRARCSVPSVSPA